MPQGGHASTPRWHLLEFRPFLLLYFNSVPVEIVSLVFVSSTVAPRNEKNTWGQHMC